LRSDDRVSDLRIVVTVVKMYTLRYRYRTTNRWPELMGDSSWQKAGYPNRRPDIQAGGRIS
jgi:hypothetical protein